MNIKFCNFDMDQSVVAPVIYGNNLHQTTNRGIELSQGVREELRCFLSGFGASASVERTPYYRIDAYFDEDTMWILEINASFVDGWGTALNLARASGIQVDPNRLIFPEQFATKAGVYLPELELFANELNALGLPKRTICDWPLNGTASKPTYVYGRVGTKEEPLILPYDGLRLDNKLNLGQFSQTWDGMLVRTPKHYMSRFQPWEEVPKDVVLKFCDKNSPECERARHSVLFGKPSGKAPFIKRCYNAETLLAQEVIQPAKENDRNCQLIIFAVGDEPVTGYVQYGWGQIINDNSVHGPLRIG
ncbi:MAG: hypothetical protein Q7S18_03310 [bacterium]|nr:hypothetical protein [bacterium]